MVGSAGAFDKAMIKKPGGFGASTAARFKDAKDTSPSSSSYSPEKAKNYINKKSSGSTSGGGFGASKAARFDGPKEVSAAGPSSYAPELAKDFVTRPERPQGKRAAGKKSTAAPPPPVTSPAEYVAALSAIEASLSNAPPCALGTRPADAAWLDRNASADGVVVLPCCFGVSHPVNRSRGRAAHT